MIITQTPFRMSFFGGGTDMESFFRENGGAVLSTTFDKYCYVNVRHLPRFFDYSTELSYSKTERVTCIEDIQHPAIRNAMKMLDMHEIRLTYEADLPARSGLGTSSSFAVGMLNAFYALNLNPFEMKVQGIDRTLADKVFAVCDYYLQGKVAKHSRHLYDIYKLLPLVPQDENFKELVKEVRAVREQSVICPSALPEANVPELLEKIIKEKAYKQDYDSLTTQLLEENVPYDTVIATLKKVAESSIFENN